MGFLHNTVGSFDRLWSASSELLHGAPRQGFLQRFGRPARVAAASLALVGTTMTTSVPLLVGLYLSCGMLALVSFIEIGRYIRTNLLAIAVFAVPLALVGSMDWVVRGEVFLRVGGVGFSRQGLHGAALVSLRALDCVSITMLLVRSAGLRGVLSGMAGLGVPAGVVAVLQMAFAHIHVLGRTAHAMVHGVRARTLRSPRTREAWAITANHGTALLGKSVRASHDVHSAMLARGFDGRFPTTEQPVRWKRGDVALVASGAAVIAAAVLL